MTLAAIGDVIPIIAIMAGLWTVKKESYRLSYGIQLFLPC